MENVMAVILGGGRGTRLFPLTRQRSKPAVPLAGKYRLIDIPVSNCLNSHINRIFVLTQFMAASLNRHIAVTYNFDAFRGESFVNSLSAEQTYRKTSDWYQGTADALRKTLMHYERYRFKEFLILSGDHIYQMDYSTMIEEHRQREADITVAALEAERQKVPELGVMQIDENGRIVNFVEKPTDESLIDGLEISPKYFSSRNEKIRKGLFLANMGVYVFNRDVLIDLLNSGNENDFGKQLLPRAVKEEFKTYAHLFSDYWEDIGTIRAFYEANLAFTDWAPKFNLYEDSRMVYTHGRHLPPSKINGAKLSQSLLGEGCIVDEAEITQSIIGIRSVINRGVRIHLTYVMGSDYCETVDERRMAESLGRPPVGIGENTHIERAIIDKNARIGRNVKLIGGDLPDVESGEGWMLCDGILVIEKDAEIPDGTRLVFK